MMEMLEDTNIMAEKLAPAVEHFSEEQLKMMVIRNLNVRTLTKQILNVKLIQNLGVAVDIVGFKNVCTPDLRRLQF